MVLTFCIEYLLYQDTSYELEFVDISECTKYIDMKYHSWKKINMGFQQFKSGC